jgi:quercetin dioxygenase-like cupin family protein
MNGHCGIFPHEPSKRKLQELQVPQALRRPKESKRRFHFSQEPPMKASPLIVKRDDVQALSVLGAQVRFLCEGSATKGVWSLMEVTLPLDAGPPPHVHDWDEAYFVIEGEVEFTLGDRRVRAGSGEFIYTPAGVQHGFAGKSAQPSRVLIFDAPAHAGAFFKRVDREVKELPRDLPKVLEIGEETGIHFAIA